MSSRCLEKTSGAATNAFLTHCRGRAASKMATSKTGRLWRERGFSASRWRGGRRLRGLRSGRLRDHHQLREVGDEQERHHHEKDERDHRAIELGDGLVEA